MTTDLEVTQAAVRLLATLGRLKGAGLEAPARARTAVSALADWLDVTSSPDCALVRESAAQSDPDVRALMYALVGGYRCEQRGWRTMTARMLSQRLCALFALETIQNAIEGRHDPRLEEFPDQLLFDLPVATEVDPPWALLAPFVACVTPALRDDAEAAGLAACDELLAWAAAQGRADIILDEVAILRRNADDDALYDRAMLIGQLGAKPQNHH